MVLYFCTCIVLFLGWLFSVIAKDKKLKTFVLIAVCLCFIAIMGFRNDITSDYSNYEILYFRINGYVETNGVFSVFTKSFYDAYLEPGYALLNVLTKAVFNNVKWLFILSAILIVLPIFLFAKQSKSPYFFLFLYVSLGTFFEGFNVMRQMIAASILLLGYKWVYEFKTGRIILITIVASLFHITSLSFIVFYLLFYAFAKLYEKKAYLNVPLLTAVMILIVFAITPLANWFIDVFKGGSYRYVEGITSMKMTNALFPVFVLVLVEIVASLFSGNQLELKKRFMILKEVNGCRVRSICQTGMYIWTALEIGVAQIPMVTRFASFLSPYGLEYITENFALIRDKKTKRVVFTAFIVVLFAYKLIKISGTYLDGYQFSI